MLASSTSSRAATLRCALRLEYLTVGWLNVAFGWWWADPVAALGMTWSIAKEGLEAWRGEECECAGAKLVTAASERPAGMGCGCAEKSGAGTDRSSPG